MFQVIGAAFWLAAGIFTGSGDPIVGLLAVLCGVVWVATMPPVAPPSAAGRKPPMLIRLE